MLIILIIWISNFSKNISSKKIQDNLEETRLPSLFESMEKDISTLKQGLNASIQEIENQASENEGQE